MHIVSPNTGIMKIRRNIELYFIVTLWTSVETVVTCCRWHSLCYKGPIANVDYTPGITACVIKAMYNTTVTVNINSHYKNVIDEKIHRSFNRLIPNTYGTKGQRQSPSPLPFTEIITQQQSLGDWDTFPQSCCHCCWLKLYHWTCTETNAQFTSISFQTEPLTLLTECQNIIIFIRCRHSFGFCFYVSHCDVTCIPFYIVFIKISWRAVTMLDNSSETPKYHIE